MIGLARARVQRPTPPVALPCPALPIALPCWLRAALPCPSRRPAGRAPPSPAFHVALLVAKSPCHARTPPCWPPHRTALPTRRPALPAHHTAGSRAALPCMRELLVLQVLELLVLEVLEVREVLLVLEVLEVLLVLEVLELLVLLVLEVLEVLEVPQVLEVLELLVLEVLEVLVLEVLEVLLVLELPLLEVMELLVPEVMLLLEVLDLLSLTKRRELETRASTLEHREPETRASVGARVPCVHRSRALAVPRTHDMTLRPSSVPQRVVLPSPPESSLLAVADPPYDLARASSPTVTRFLAMVVTDPTLSSPVPSALVVELVEFAVAYRVDYLTVKCCSL
ncbi:unnamed protein product [Closterium sp. NIES-54]